MLPHLAAIFLGELIRLCPRQLFLFRSLLRGLII